MQEIYNSGWYANNEVCSWPLTNTLYSVDGIKLSDSILSDIRIVTVSDTLFYLSGVQITDKFVSIVISSEQGIAASVTLKQPVTVHRNYVLNTFIQGLSGTVAFGHGVLLERGSWHFAPEANLLDGSCIRLTQFPVTAIGIQTDNLLTGRVILEPGTDLSITPCTVSLGHTREEGSESVSPAQFGTGYKISLSADSDKRSTSAQDQTALLSAYAGPCQMRPENNDCPYITEINGVSPDENGNITIKVGSGLSLNQVLIPADSVLQPEEIENCLENELYSNTLLVSADEPYLPYTASTPVRRCGRDLCETDGSSGGSSDSDSDSDSGSDGESTEESSFLDTDIPQDSWSMRIPSRSVVLFPRPDNYGVVYVTETDTLEPAGDGRAFVYFMEPGSSQAYAAFELAAGYDCGILYNLDPTELSGIHLFNFKNKNVSLGNRVTLPVRETPSLPARISMAISYKDGKFQGVLRLYDGDTVYSKELSITDTKKGTYGLYMRNCKCLMWSEK